MLYRRQYLLNSGFKHFTFTQIKIVRIVHKATATGPGIRLDLNDSPPMFQLHYRAKGASDHQQIDFEINLFTLIKKLETRIEFCSWMPWERMLEFTMVV